MTSLLNVAVAAGAIILLAGLALVLQTSSLLRANDGGPVPPSLAGGSAPTAAIRPVSAAELERAVSIALDEPLIARLGGRAAVQVTDPRAWLRSDGDPLGVVFTLVLGKPVSGSFPFVVHQYKETRPDTPPYERRSVPTKVEGMTSITVAVDLKAGVVAEMAPGPGTVAELQDGSPDETPGNSSGRRPSGQ